MNNTFCYSPNRSINNNYQLNNANDIHNIKNIISNISSKKSISTTENLLSSPINFSIDKSYNFNSTKSVKEQITKDKKAKKIKSKINDKEHLNTNEINNEYNECSTKIKNNKVNPKNKSQEPKSKINKEKILDSSKSVYKQTKSKLSNQERDELFQFLYNENKLKNEKLRQISKLKEQKFSSIYTFTPELIKNEKYNNYNNTNFYDRQKLFTLLKNDKLKKIKNELENSQSPTKNINSNNVNVNQMLINSKNFIKNKKEKIEKIKKDLLKEQGITFKPILNNNKNIKSNVVNRNNEFLKIKNSKLENNITDDFECTFSPKINKYLSTNENNKSANSYIKNSVNAGKRLFNYKKIYDKNLLNQMEIKNNDDEECSFKPEISKNTDKILNNKYQFLYSNYHNIYENEINKRIVNMDKLKNNNNNQLENIEKIENIDKLNDEELLKYAKNYMSWNNTSNKENKKEKNIDSKIDNNAYIDYNKMRNTNININEQTNKTDLNNNFNYANVNNNFNPYINNFISKTNYTPKNFNKIECENNMGKTLTASKQNNKNGNKKSFINNLAYYDKFE